MNAHTQYITLYQAQRANIDAHSAPLLNAHRNQAIALLSERGLGDADTDFTPDFGLNLSQLPLAVNPYEAFRCDVPGMSTLLYLIVNDTFYPHAQPGLPAGVLVGSLRSLAVSHKELLERHYHRLAGSDTRGEVALNTAFAQDGFVLYVPKGVVVEKPIQLVNIARGDQATLVNRRLLVILEEGAEASLLVCDHALNEGKFLSNQVTEIVVERGAKLRYYDLEENGDDTTRFSSLYVDQAADSQTHINAITLDTGATHNRYHIALQGEGANTSLLGIAIADKSQTVSNISTIDHRVPRCNSNELFRYILDQQAQGVFGGNILVRPGAKQTVAYQGNKNLCLSSEALMRTQPQLEIYTDDVKCSHGASTGQIDQNALFYLRSRGIPLQEAKLLLMFAFAHDIIEQISLEGLRDRLRLLIEKRFRGELAKCEGCKNRKSPHHA